MTDIRIPGEKAASILESKFKLDWHTKNFIMSQCLTGYTLPKGDQIGKDLPYECLFYNDIDIHRYSYPEKDKVVWIERLLLSGPLLFGIWVQNQDNPDYPYKLDAYAYFDTHGFTCLVKELDNIRDLLRWSLGNFLFPKTQIEIISKAFDIKYEEDKE